MELNVHDLVTLKENQSTEEAYQSTINFVKDIEKLNYKRYWFAEHHNLPTQASSSPELLVAYAAAQTDRIRLGTGGTMIMNYSPLKVAENFKTLTALAPDRIDLGLGRAPGGGEAEILALAQGNREGFGDQYNKIQVILDYLLDKKASSYYGNTKAMPITSQSLSQPWMLGSSGQSALKAAEMGLGYSFAKFFGLETDPQVFKDYRDNFQPSEFFDKPSVMVSYNIVVADSMEEADYLAKPIEMSQMALAQGRLMPIMNPENLKDYQYNQAEERFLQSRYDKNFMIKGTKGHVQSILEKEIETLGVDEIMVYAPLYDYDSRLRSYRYLAEIFGKI